MPEVLNTEIYDEIIRVENEDAFDYGKVIAIEEGILVGISSGAALYAAIQVAKRKENKGKTIVAFCQIMEIDICQHHCFHKCMLNVIGFQFL